jgi:serine/threonine protein kinase, bacterial
MQVKLLGSRYQIIEPLGQGGFGKTYLAEDIQLPKNPKCVVKQFHPSFSDSSFLETARRLFNTEAETLQKLGNHPQIPQLLAHFEQEQEFYLVQQFIDGHTLSKELVSDKRWSQTDAIEFFQDCLSILDFIHSNGVIHRDIKPDNIIRRQQDNKVVLVDFGTVKEIVLAQTQLVNSTVAVGTRGYMPTEQARGKPRITSDIYALGIIGIQALTGVHPIQFQEDENGEFLWESQADTSSEFAAIINKMVRYHFKDRYQSAKEVLEELASLQSTRTTNSSPVEYTPTNILDLSQLNDVIQIHHKTEVINPKKLLSETNIPLEQPPSVPIIPENQNLSEPSSNKSNLSYIPDTKQVEKIAKSNSNNSQINLTAKTVNFFKSENGKIVSGGLLIAAIATGGMSFFKYHTAEAQKQKSENAIAVLEELQNKKSYEECYKQTDSDQIKQIDISEAERLKIRGECGLSWAQEQASLNKFVEAFDIASEIDNKFPNYNKVQEYKEQWTEAILKQATDIYQKEGDLDKAIATIAQIKSGSSVKEKSLILKKQWEEDYQKNSRLLEEIETAINRDFWESAIGKAQELINNAQQSQSSYWEKQGLALKNQAETELNKPSQTKTENTVINQSQSSNSNQNSGNDSKSTQIQSNQDKQDIKPPESNQDKQDNQSSDFTDNTNLNAIDDGGLPMDLCANNALMTGDSCP